MESPIQYSFYFNSKTKLVALDDYVRVVAVNRMVGKGPWVTLYQGGLGVYRLQTCCEMP
ncbi:MAG: hypothetical protein ACI9DO_001697 [Reinekea sp.]|jgi:hypothetical protein